LENYIVRIYRRDHDESAKVAGIVLPGLWNLLKQTRSRHLKILNYLNVKSRLGGLIPFRYVRCEFIWMTMKT